MNSRTLTNQSRKISNTKPARSQSYTVINESLQNPLYIPKAYNKPSEFLESIAIDRQSCSQEKQNSDFTFNPQNKRKKFKSIFEEKFENLKFNERTLKFGENKENINNFNEIKGRFFAEKDKVQRNLYCKVNSIKNVRSNSKISNSNPHNLPVKAFPQNISYSSRDECKATKYEPVYKISMKLLENYSYRSRINKEATKSLGISNKRL